MAGDPEKGSTGQEPAEEPVRDDPLPRYKRGPIDMPFFLLVVILLVIGVITVLSASFARAYFKINNPTYFFIRQLIFAAVGIAAMLIVSRLPVRLFREYAHWLYVLAFVLLLLVPFIGITINGAKRWLGVPGTSFTFQPSEIAKLALIIMYARVGANNRKTIRKFSSGVLPYMLLIIPFAVLLVLENHVSAAAIMVVIAGIMMLAGGTSLPWLIGLAGAGVGAIGVYLYMSGYNASRFTGWSDPFADKLDSGWQIVQSLYAIGSGGLLGVGVGQSRQKYLYLPEEYNDYIFSIFCEEMGFVGAVLLLVLFAVLIARGFYLAMHARDSFGAMLITGITSLLALQVIMNVAVVTNTIPSTGISLPFFSYGGTALLLQSAEIGIILSVSRDIPLKQRERAEKK